MESRRRRLQALCVAPAGSPGLAALLDHLGGGGAPDAGFDVHAMVAGGADQLAAALAAGGWDVVLVDAAGTPALDVVQATALVREHDPELAVIASPLPPPAALLALVDRELLAAALRRGRDARQARQLAEDRLMAMGLLASAVSHEINNPLAAVLANVELALRAAEEAPDPASGAAGTPLDPGELCAELRDAHEAAHLVREIVRDVKLFSRPGDDRPTPLDVRELLEAALRLAGHELRHRARVVKQLGAVPPVWATEGRLAQLLWNVVVTAALAIPPGRAEHNRLHAITRTDVDGRAVVQIADSAPAAAEGDDRGAGLRIAAHLARELGGDLDVRRDGDRGTTVTIVLPGAAAVRAGP
jgi:signal transduction histidine kinase